MRRGENVNLRWCESEYGKMRENKTAEPYFNPKSEMKLIHLLKLGTSKGNLLFIAALVWTFAGIMLFTRGILMLGMDHDFYLLRLAGSLIGGILFYMILFTRISKKYVNRIIHLTNDRPSIFSFFNPKGYLMMIGMISLGIFLRKSGIIAPFYLSILYMAMGIPLFVSSLRFYYSGINYHSIVEIKQ